MSCIVKGCKSRRARKENTNEFITFHRFPKNELILSEWKQRISRPDWTPKTHSSICSKHFETESFEENITMNYRRLKANAMPTLNLPDEMNSLSTAQSLLKNVNLDDLEPSRIALPKASDPNIEKPGRNPMGDIQFTDAVPVINCIPKASHQHYKRPLSQENNMASKRLKLITTDEIKNELEACKKKILRLEKELERVKKVSKRRLRKINTLMKRNARSNEKTAQLYNTLMKNVKQDVALENTALLECINKNEVVKRFLEKQKQVPLSREYNLELKKFAVTLQYLSPRAYSFLRESFDNVLPHPKTISAWYKGINCSPGFTTESLDAIRARVEINPKKKIFCALAIDEMAIRKLVEWDGHNMTYYGYVNLGLDLDSDCATIATQSLTFMLTSLNDSWKIPVGYFLVSSITAQQKSMLVEQCIHLVHECGVVVASLTYDGAANNIAMSSHLGCETSSGAVSFQCAGSEVCLWPDPCHNIKLVRNAFADKKTLEDEDGNKICWEYIELLQKIQQEEGLHLGNKLKKEHVNFVKQKMKVCLATQLLSNSVADALQYCKDKGLWGFEKCEGTIKFLRIFNNLFDIFNSRNIRAKLFKKALAPFNFEEIKTFFAAAESYIRNLKTSNGIYLINSNRKTGFNGFIVCMKSLTKMFHDLVVNDSLQYLCTYKLSQDHLELFFGAIRAKCGFNNNPSARMFQAAYKKLLVHAQFKDGSSGNCVPLDRITVLNCSSKKTLDAINKSSDNLRIVCDDNTEDANPETSNNLSVNNVLDHDHFMSSHVLSEYSADVVHYVSGFVVKKLLNTLKCEQCLDSLTLYDKQHLGRVTLISVKDRGGLIWPSKDVSKVCETTEKIIREQICKDGGQSIGTRKQVLYTTNKVFGSFQFSSIFENLSEHSFEQDFQDNHRNLMIKLICRMYLTIRIHHLTKQKCEPFEKIRHHLTKSIIFQGQ